MRSHDFPQWWQVPAVESYLQRVEDPALQELQASARAEGSVYFRAALVRMGGRGRAAEDQEYAEVLWDGDVGVGWVACPDAEVETIVADSLAEVIFEAFPEISEA